MDHPSQTSTLPSARLWHSQTPEPDTPATYPLPEEAGNDELRIQSVRAPTNIAVHRIPMEIWIAVCEALRRLDLIDFTNEWDKLRKGYRELLRETTNKNRPDPIITAVSILSLSLTCRYLHKVTSPSLLETIRLSPPSSGGESNPRYLSFIQQVKSLHLNGDQRLQHVRGFAATTPFLSEFVSSEYESDIRNQICHLLARFPNLRHLTLVGVRLDVPLMHGILTLPLEHLWLWDAEPYNPITDQSFILTTTPKTKLRSLVLKAGFGGGAHRLEPTLPSNWTSELIGTAMQDLSFDESALIPGFLPVLPDLEILEGPDMFCGHRATPSMLCRVLSKTPNLKEAAFPGQATLVSPSDALPALSQLQRVVCDHSWLHLLMPGRRITTVRVFCHYARRLQELLEILPKGNVPIRDLTLSYPFMLGMNPRAQWSPDGLEPVARYLPGLEILRLDVHDPKMEGLQDAMLYISQLQKLRVVSINVWESGPLDEVWQESKLREFLGLTKSPVLERVGFAQQCEWKLEETGLWMLWQGGRMVRSVSL